MAIGSTCVSADHGTLHRFVSPARSTGGEQRGVDVDRAGRVNRTGGRLSRVAVVVNRAAVAVANVDMVRRADGWAVTRRLSRAKRKKSHFCVIVGPPRDKRNTRDKSTHLAAVGAAAPVPTWAATRASNDQSSPAPTPLRDRRMQAACLPGNQRAFGKQEDSPTASYPSSHLYDTATGAGD